MNDETFPIQLRDVEVMRQAEKRMLTMSLICRPKLRITISLCGVEWHGKIPHSAYKTFRKFQMDSRKTHQDLKDYETGQNLA